MENPTYLGLIKHFVGVVYADRKGKVLLSIWGSFFVWLLTLKKKKQIQAQDDGVLSNKSDETEEEKKKKKADGDSLKQMVKILLPHFTKFNLPTASLLFYVLSLATRILITVKLADLSGELAGYLGSRKFDDMFRGQVRFGLICLVAAFTTTAMKTLEKQVALSIRDVLFKDVMRSYMNDNLAFLKQDIGDAPARMTADLQDFSSEFAHSIGHFLKPLIDVIHLTLVLRERAGAINMAVFFTFFFCSDFAIKKISKQALPQSLKQLASENLRLESKLRDRLTAVNDYKEQIALQRGKDTESQAIFSNYAELKRSLLREQASYAFLDLISNYVFKYGGLMTAFSILTPSTYLNQTKTSEAIVSDFLSNSSLLGALASAIKDLADVTQSLPRVRGLASRVFELKQRLALVERIHQTTTRAVKNNVAEEIVVENLTVGIPNPLGREAEPCKEVLIERLNMHVKPSQHYVIKGPNGAGKSSLIRVFGGLWFPIDGCVLLPLDKVFIVPQEAYFVKHGTLLEQICYPDQSSSLRTEELVAILRSVGLNEVLQRYDVEKSRQDWGFVLSGGQKQRLSFARLFYRATIGKASFALLDEPASAISQEAIVELFELAKKVYKITLITVSHSEVIDKQHAFALNLSKTEKWNVEKLY